MTLPLTLTIPSKTFILGEYSVLSNQPTLLVASQPTCCVRIHQTETPSISLSPNSPAGRFYHKHLKQLGLQLTFSIPERMKDAGLGISGAEWLSVYLAHRMAKQQPFSLWDRSVWQSCLLDYQSHQPNMSIPGSGADWLCQMLGGYLYYDPKNQRVTPTQWPFKDHSWILLQTGHKCATHEHLNSLKDTQPFSAWGQIVRQSWQYWQVGDADGFIEQVKMFQQQLRSSGKTAEQTQLLLQYLMTIEGIVCAKGCGAMGADTIWLMCRRDKIAAVHTALRERSITVVANENDIHHGVTWQQ